LTVALTGAVLIVTMSRMQLMPDALELFFHIAGGHHVAIGK